MFVVSSRKSYDQLLETISNGSDIPFLSESIFGGVASVPKMQLDNVMRGLVLFDIIVALPINEASAKVMSFWRVVCCK